MGGFAISSSSSVLSLSSSLVLSVTIDSGELGELSGLDFFERSSEEEKSSEDKNGNRFSACEENDEELDIEDVDSDGDASRDIDRSRGLSVKDVWKGWM